jgi:hypothetical protein
MNLMGGPSILFFVQVSVGEGNGFVDATDERSVASEGGLVNAANAPWAFHHAESGGEKCVTLIIQGNHPFLRLMQKAPPLLPPIHSRLRTLLDQMRPHHHPPGSGTDGY